MTTEELYDFMKRGFDQIQTQFETLNKRLENIETRLGSVENDVAWIKGKLGGKVGFCLRKPNKR